MKQKFLIGMTLLLVGVTLLAGCSAPASPSVEPQSITFDVELIEVKGSTDGIEAPGDNPVDLSSGYRFKPPGEYDPENPNKWEVSTYMFSPGSMSVFQGDEVTLRMFGVNGDEHGLSLVAPDGTMVATDTLNRGRELTITFLADQPGYYKLICGNHAPTMQAPIQVIPVN